MQLITKKYARSCGVSYNICVACWYCKTDKERIVNNMYTVIMMIVIVR